MTTKRFSTFEGVFTPCLLSILGVIMYLRLGWVVGQVGLGGAIMIITLANVITLATALSMSSVVTNIRIGTGGAYSIITKSLGIEAGGAIGIPLYISQAISVAFYIAGFSECWKFVFPHHPELLVSLILWSILLIITCISAKLGFRIQYIIMALIALSLVSIVAGQRQVVHDITFFDAALGENLWMVFAVFFPAVTGILAGASMSGELKDPRISIPKGTLWAIGVSFLIYLLLAYWFAKQVPLDQLRDNYTIAIDLGRWRWLVIAGIMGATLSSALAMFIGSPRVLLALGKHSIFPLSSSFTRINKRGEPITAILFTSLIALVTILFSNLNEIAGLLTMFFLITYGMINLTVFIEKTMGIVSFRPSFQVWRIIPFLGSVGCLAVMFLVNVKFTFISIFVIILIYFILIKREAQVYSPDIRSGALVFLAELFAKAASKLPYYPKIWKPNLLVPVYDKDQFDRIIGLIRDIVYPAGRVTVFQPTSPTADKDQKNDQLSESLMPLKDEGIFVESSAVETDNLISGSVTILQTLKRTIFPPNTLFYILDENPLADTKAQPIISKASEEGMGIIVLKLNQKVGVSQEKIINLWIRKGSPNIDLSVLIALQLERNWEGNVKILQVVGNELEKEEAYGYLKKMKELMRMPADVEMEVLVGNFKQAITEAPPADINIFGMPEDLDMNLFVDTAAQIKTSVLFLKDSKHESAVA